ncbi:MAG: type III pantothenate kinase [Candidatus Hydrogenedentota bacterium]
MIEKLLLMDIGNSNTDIAVGDNYGRILKKVTIETVKDKLPQSLINTVVALKREYLLKKVIISSVVPEIDILLKEFLKGDEHFIIEFVSYEKVREFISIPCPYELGADRICNVLYIVKTRRYPAIVIDAGTATTFDIINEKGKYIGGVIFPGIMTSFKSLDVFTSKLGLVTEPQKRLLLYFGNTTNENIQIGVIRSQIYTINGFINDIRKIVKNYYIWGTGGMFSSIKSYLEVNCINFNLTLQGLICYFNIIKEFDGKTDN